MYLLRNTISDLILIDSVMHRRKQRAEERDITKRKIMAIQQEINYQIQLDKHEKEQEKSEL